MNTISKDQHWIDLITQCRASGLTDRQWCLQNGIPVSTFYYHARSLRKKTCKILEAADPAASRVRIILEKSVAVNS